MQVTAHGGPETTAKLTRCTEQYTVDQKPQRNSHDGLTASFRAHISIVYLLTYLLTYLILLIRSVTTVESYQNHRIVPSKTVDYVYLWIY